MFMKLNYKLMLWPFYWEIKESNLGMTETSECLIQSWIKHRVKWDIFEIIWIIHNLQQFAISQSKWPFFFVFHLRRSYFGSFFYFEENIFTPMARRVNSHPFLMQFWEIHPLFFTLKSLNSIVFMFLRSLIKERGSEVVQSCPTLCDPMDCSLPGFSIHGIFQARILEWFAISFSRGSSWPRNRTRVSWAAGRLFTEPLGKPY